MAPRLNDPTKQQPLNIVMCRKCHTAYLFTPEQVLALQLLDDTAKWLHAAIGYAVAAGWRRLNGALLCTAHTGDGSSSSPATARRA